MSERLETDIAQYANWREQLLAGLAAFEAWLKANGDAVETQLARLSDIAQNVRDERLVLAFLAEFSRGKTELINALFFGDLKRRLLPSAAGRTTMCPTEIFFDPGREPSLRLLPIETRSRDGSIDSLKREPRAWTERPLNVDSHREVERELRRLTEQKSVPIETARELGLADAAEPGEDGLVVIPAWRHALVNYPHPLLASGLVVLDTPGLNALGAEPELTLSMIPNAHAVLFVLGTDTGVTQSDLEVWRRVVQSADVQSVAVLNKIDLLWDELKSPAAIADTIAGQVDKTAALLAIPRADVFAVSAQKALLAQTRDDDALLEKSGILALENFLLRDIIPTRRKIVFNAVHREVSSMLTISSELVNNDLASNRDELTELAALSGKNRGVVAALLRKLEIDRAAHNETVEIFRNTRQVVMKQGKALMLSLDPEQLDELLEKNRALMEASWTTPGITGAMQLLFDHFSRHTAKVLNYSQQTSGLVEAIYARFHQKYGFAKLAPPPLNLERHRHAMTILERKAQTFVHDPLNVMLEKRFLIRRFYHGLVRQAKVVYGQAHTECALWQQRVLAPIALQLQEHERVIGRRVQNVRAISDNLDTLQERLANVEHRHGASREKSLGLERVARMLAGAESLLRDQTAASARVESPGLQ